MNGPTENELTPVLGGKCPECGWRRQQHRPAIGEPARMQPGHLTIR